MIQFLVLLTLVNSIICHDIPELVNENVKILNFQKCESNCEWTRVKYRVISVIATHSSNLGVRANRYNCESVPIDVKRRNTLIFVVHSKAFDINSGLVISVILEENIIAKLIYNRASDNFEEEWKEISLKVDKSGLANINLLGYSRDNEMVLIDSVNYIHSNNTNIDISTDKGLVIINNKHEEINVEQKIDTNLNIKGVNNNLAKDRNDYLRLEDAHFRDNNNNSNSLGTWAIVLISLGCVTVTALVAVSAYYIGKFRAKPKVIPVVYDIEPPKVEIIPRVRGLVEPIHYNF